jgi:cell division transport system permease protein
MNIQTYFLHHLHALQQSLQNLYRTPVATLLTLAVLSISLLLPTILLVLLDNAKPIIRNFDTGNHMAIYLKQNINTEKGKEITENLKKRTDISNINFVSAEQGLQDFSKASGLTEAFAALSINPLPAVIEFKPLDTNPDNLTRLQTELSQIPEVDWVKFDTQWVKRLFAIVDLIQQFIYGLAAVLAIAVLLIIGNTIRNIVQAHHAEILVLKLVGASNHFIRRPFVYTGVIYGFIAGLFALILSAIFMHWLNIPAETLAALYNSPLQLQGVNFSNAIILLGISMLLGILGAWAALTEHLLDVEVRA